MSGVFDLDAFLGDLTNARGESDAVTAIRGVLERAVSDGDALADALRPDEAGIGRLHVADDLTVINVVWAPKMSIKPHNHNMWALIGLYGGAEDNAFFRREGDGIVEAGGRQLRTGDVLALGEAAIHAVTNPLGRFTGAIHVYGGDFFTKPRSEWDPETFEERPYDMEATLRHFAEQDGAEGREA